MTVVRWLYLHSIDRYMVRHEFRGLHFTEMYASGFTRTIGERAGTWRSKTSLRTCRHVGSHDTSHGGYVDHTAGLIGCGTFCQNVVEVSSCVEHRLHVESVDLIFKDDEEHISEVSLDGKVDDIPDSSRTRDA